jgi:quinol monooxygenase YgiN
MVVLMVKLRVKPGSEEQCKRYMRAMEENTRREAGCLMYVAHQAVDDPTQLAFYEQYTDMAALDIHGKSSYFAEYVTNGLLQFVVERERMLCQPIS